MDQQGVREWGKELGPVMLPSRWQPMTTLWHVQPTVSLGVYAHQNWAWAYTHVALSNMHECGGRTAEPSDAGEGRAVPVQWPEKTSACGDANTL